VNDNNKQTRHRRDLQLAALLASVTVIGCFLVYWFVQIEDVREMLKLAYG